MSMIDTWVSVTGGHAYPARLDPSHCWNGWVSPAFTLDAVRQLADHTDEDAEAYGHECVDQVHIIEGTQPVVLFVRWQYFTESPKDSVNVVVPDADGLYWIGGCEWTWYEVKDGPIFYTRKDAFKAWRRVLLRSGQRIGEILRTRAPHATSCLVDPSLGRIVRVEDVGAWRTFDDDGLDVFDTASLSEADDVLQKALDHGRDPVSLEDAGWRPARDSGRPELHRIHFAPAAKDPAGDAPVDEARDAATAARRKLLMETVPYLAADVREARPDAIGVVVDPDADQPFVTFVAETGARREGTIPGEQARKLRERMQDMFVYRPTREDLTACGWVPVTAEHVPGTYALIFPAE
ncbi:hypothetical protein OG216_19465 [Streptomycetaceae bacterium NBC_01309]